MIADKKEFYGGLGMMAGFFVVLALIFMPFFNGQNSLNFLDNLFNSISKGSAYYIPGVKEEAARVLSGKSIDLPLSYETEAQARSCAALFEKGGAEARVEGATIKVTGNLEAVMANCLEDADSLFHNRSETLQAKYNGMDGRQALFNWWVSLKAMQKSLNNNKQFKEAKIVYTVMTKAVECAYNYYRIEPQNMMSRLGVVIFALAFYVVYTLWYGYAIMFMFEGWGLRISH